MLMSILAFVVAIVILVGIHEWGHFWVARRCGIKVLRFSIGFGRPLWRWRGRQDETEYVIAAIPLGGYVSMLDEREGPVAAHERHRAFNRQSIPKRAAVVIAGPLVNLLFAVIALALAGLWGETGLRPWVGQVMPDSPAMQAGMQVGDEILAVNDTPTKTWRQVLQALAVASVQGGEVVVQVRDAQGRSDWRLWSLPGDIAERTELLHELGLQPKQPVIPPLIGRVLAGGAAAQAGLQVGDRIVSADGVAITNWSDWVATIRARPDEMIRLVVERSGLTESLVLRPEVHHAGERVIGRIGVLPQPLSDDILAAYRVTYQLSPWQALITGVTQTRDMVVLTGQVIWRILTGAASVQHLSGPLSIADAAGQSAQQGLTSFLKFLAMISLSLGVLNLLPIPVLDGGHLVYLALEAVRGSPLPDAWLAFGQRLGLAVLGSLMVLVFYLDIQRFSG